MPALSNVAREKLQSLERKAQKRVLTPASRSQHSIITREGKRLISFSCNDYLGLSQHEMVKQAAAQALQTYGAGSGAARHVTGNHPLYARLESKLATSKGMEAALVFGSGYLANTGVIPALVGKGDLILADRLVHACLIDGAQLSGAGLMRFRHNDMRDCESLLRKYRPQYRHCLLVTDEIFSMDGDAAPLRPLAALAAKHETWLMVDGAHALGKPDAIADIYVGTLSKSFGAYGGYACGARDVIDYLANSARSFMFSTALPPSVIASAEAALDIMTQHPELLDRPVENARLFTHLLGLPDAVSSIVPLFMGTEENALRASQTLAEAGYGVTAIRPPTVPAGTSRLRFTFSAAHRKEDIVHMAEFIKRHLQWKDHG